MTPEAIIDLEATVYPAHMQQMQDCEDWEDIADYCEVEDESDLLVMGVAGKWYCLVARQDDEVEFVDIAAHRSIPPLFKILRAVKEFAGGLPIYCDARQSTSWRIIERLSRKGRFSCQVEETYDWAGETMHRVCITL